MDGQGQGQGSSKSEIGPKSGVVEGGDGDVQVINDDDSTMIDNNGPISKNDDGQLLENDDGDKKMTMTSRPKRMIRTPKKLTFTTNDDLVNNNKKLERRGRIGNIRDADREIYKRLKAYDPTKDGTQVDIKGQLQYKCNTCQTILVTKSDFFHHNLLHTGEKPYICKYENCTVGFTQPGGRMIHEMSHSRTKTKGGRNNYKSMKMDQEKSSQPPKLHPQTLIKKIKMISDENQNKNRDRPGPASSKIKKIMIQSPTSTTSQIKIIGQSNHNKHQEDQINKVGQGQNPGLVSDMLMSSNQFEELKQLIQSSILESENRIMAKMDTLEDKIDDYRDQLNIRSVKINFLDREIDYIAKKTLILKK